MERKHDSNLARSWLRDYVRLLRREYQYYDIKADFIEEYLAEQEALENAYMEDLTNRANEALAKLKGSIR